MDIIWDTIEGGRVEIGDGVVTVTRGALVTDIPAADFSDPYVLIRAVALAVQTSTRAAPGTAGTVLSGLVAVGAKGTNDARIAATYTSPQDNKGGGGVRWVVEDESSLASEYTEIDPLGEALHTKYNPPNAGPAPSNTFPGGLNTSPGEGIPYPFHLNPPRPRRALSIHGYLIGKPDAVVLNAEGCLNDAPWPSGSLFKNDPPKRLGCWLCSDVSASVERPGVLPQVVAQQLYRVSARFTTKGKLIDKNGRFAGDKDWSDYAVHKNIMGRIPQDMLTKDQVDAVKDLMKQPYQVGQVHKVNGYTKVGMFGLYDFKQAFGF